jgi:hypothetical protein
MCLTTERHAKHSPCAAGGCEAYHKRCCLQPCNPAAMPGPHGAAEAMLPIADIATAVTYQKQPAGSSSMAHHSRFYFAGVKIMQMQNTSSTHCVTVAAANSRNGMPLTRLTVCSLMYLHQQQQQQQKQALRLKYSTVLTTRDAMCHRCIIRPNSLCSYAVAHTSSRRCSRQLSVAPQAPTSICS